MALRNVRRSERGFTLIELGIVIAVIGILAAAVLVGRGFLESAKLSKASEAVSTITKAARVYAGTQGGLINEANTALEGKLQARQLIPAAIMPTGWVLKAVANNAGGPVVQVSVTCPSKEMCTDLYNSFNNLDPSYTKTATTVGTTACHIADPNATQANLCFNL